MKPALGKGLEALLPKNTGPESNEMDLERITAAADQPRKRFEENGIKELSASIKAKGILQPLIVTPNGDGSFKLIAGERRLRAARMAGLKKVPVIIRKSADQDRLETALVENIQREDLNPMEIARGLEHLQGFGLTQEALAERLSMDRASIGHYLRILKLPEETKALVAEGKLSLGHAKVLLSVERPAEIDSLAARAIKEGLSVRALERLVKESAAQGTGRNKAKAIKAVDPNIKDLEDKLLTSLGTRVRIKHGAAGRGKMEIEYYSLDQLQGILDRML
ncbi:MAG: ParB/RepB/Spo0J family partition protein [Actinomycetota bacterium]|nr:ParB/RepB/Spo0J family partition protein [Actinomycetota bacterium]